MSIHKHNRIHKRIERLFPGNVLCTQIRKNFVEALFRWFGKEEEVRARKAKFHAYAFKRRTEAPFDHLGPEARWIRLLPAVKAKRRKPLVPAKPRLR